MADFSAKPTKWLDIFIVVFSFLLWSEITTTLAMGQWLLSHLPH
jgi:hypothetical protein